jgi:cytochrome P450
MPSTSTILSWLLVPFLALAVARTYAMIANYLQARKLGIPIVVTPVSSQEALWIIVQPYLRRFRHVPGLRNALTFGDFAWAQDERHRPHQKYGNVFAIVSPGRTEIVVNDPVAAVEVQSHYKTWLKPGDLYDIFDGFGPNVLSINGEDWQRHRRIVNPAFREQNNKLVWEESSRQARQMLRVASERPGARRTMLDVRNDCVLIAMHVLSAAGFGHVHDFDGGFREVPEGHRASLAEALKFLLQNIIFGVLFQNVPLLRWVFPALSRQMSDMGNEFRQYMKELIAYNRAITQGGGNSYTADIVSALVEADEAAKRDQKTTAHGSTAKPMHLTDAELLGDLYIFNLAGFETTANALTYTLPFLAINRDVQDWAGEEVDAVLRGRDVEKLAYEDVFPSLVRCLALMVRPPP